MGGPGLETKGGYLDEWARPSNQIRGSGGMFSK